MPPKVEGAISWFFKGDTAGNPVDEFASYWIGLEMLAPSVTGPWHCEACKNDVPECPHCGHSTKGPKSVQTIRQFLINDLGVSSKEFKELYKLRNKISHGEISLDIDSVSGLSQKTTRLQQLLLRAIKKTIGWVEDRPPHILPEGPGITIQKGVALELKIELPSNAPPPSKSYYDSFFATEIPAPKRTNSSKGRKKKSRKTRSRAKRR